MTKYVSTPKIDRRELWAVFVLLATGPVTLLVYALFALGFKVFFWLVDRDLHAAARVWEIGYGAFFGAVNLVYNLTIGSLMFAERPRFAQFTRRLKYHKQRDHAVAFFLCEMLNVFDPDHC